MFTVWKRKQKKEREKEITNETRTFEWSTTQVYAQKKKFV